MRHVQFHLRIVLLAAGLALGLWGVTLWAARNATSEQALAQTLPPRPTAQPELPPRPDTSPPSRHAG